MSKAGNESIDFSGVEQLAERYVAERKSAGMLTLVSRHGEVVHRHCAGHADVEQALALREDTIFRIYSMTKPLTSVALLQLIERGLCALDDDASRWIPALGKLEVHGEGPLQSAITIRQLLTHTAGFSYGFEPDKNPVDPLYAEIWQGGIQHRTLEDLMGSLLRLPLLAQPGTRWHYSIATDVCGYLVERLTDMPFGDYLRSRIIEPLGMVDTDFEVAADRVERFATLYGPTGQSPLTPLETADRSPFVPSLSGMPVQLHSGGGGLVSTAPDYLRFAQMMLNGGELDGQRLLAAETVALMTRNHVEERLLPLRFNGVAEGDYAGYGFGLGYCINIDPTRTAAAGSRGDFGWGGMADTYCWIDPAEQLIGILMQQHLPSLVHAGRKDFRDAVYAALNG
jgi:CubicO group peptidase (beta-lactamase class C family)